MPEENTANAPTPDQQWFADVNQRHLKRTEEELSRVFNQLEDTNPTNRQQPGGDQTPGTSRDNE